MIGPSSEQLGVVMRRRALDMAKEHNLDLVEVAPTAKPPVCRIINYSKYKYDQEKKERRIKKNQKIGHLKQIRLKPFIDENDYQIKLRQVIGFLQKKDKVKINMYFRGREMSHKELGLRIINRMIADSAEHGQPEKTPLMEGRIMSAVLAPVSSPSFKEKSEAVN